MGNIVQYIDIGYWNIIAASENIILDIIIAAMNMQAILLQYTG
jgi:hypothetical protein